MSELSYNTLVNLCVIVLLCTVAEESIDFRGKILMYSNVLSCSNMIEQYKKVIEYCFVIAVLTYKM